MENKLVSIIIPCYNVEKYMKNCFECLDSQTYKNVEIIFVDDGAKDSTGQMIDDYCKTNNKAKAIHKPNGGLSSARNAGLDAATGDYIYFYDPDDILSKDILTTLVSTIEVSNAQYAICYCKKVDDGENLTRFINRETKGKKIKILDTTETFSLMTSKYKIFTSVWNKLYLAKIIQQNNLRFGENCRYGEDTPFNYAYLRLIEKVAVINRVQYYYVQRKNSLIHDKFKENRLTVFPLYNNILKNDSNSLTPYIHLMRLYSSVECLYFIKKSDYSNADEINKLFSYIKEDIKFVKKCKHVRCYRRMFLPLAHGAFKGLLKKRLKNNQK